MGELPESVQNEQVRVSIHSSNTCIPGTFPMMGTVTTNLMVHASSKNSCSIWISCDRDKLARQLKLDTLRNNNKFLVPFSKFTVSQFPVYLIKQKEGDLVILPPHSMYQCVQRV